MEVNWTTVGKIDFDEQPVSVPTIANAVVNAKYNNINEYKYTQFTINFKFNKYYTGTARNCNTYILCRCTYLKPACFIRSTPSQNWKYKLDGGHCVVGKCARGKRNPESHKKMNWSKWLATCKSDIPLIKIMGN